MTQPASSYDDDFFVWTQQQAAALRRNRALANDIDIAHVAEEIEDLGKCDLREVASFLKRLFEHLIKIRAVPASPDVPRWRKEALTFADGALDPYTPSMRHLLDLQATWRRATKSAQRLIAEMDASYPAPDTCPFLIDDLLTEDFDLDATLAKLAVVETGTRGEP